MPVSIGDWHEHESLRQRLAETMAREIQLRKEVAELQAVAEGRRVADELQTEMEKEVETLTTQIVAQVDRQCKAALGIGLRRLGMLLQRWMSESCRERLTRWRFASATHQHQQKEEGKWALERERHQEREREREMLLASQQDQLQQVLQESARRATEAEEKQMVEREV